MRIALVQCPVWGVDDPPLALAQLAGCLLSANHEPHWVDLNIELWAGLPEDSRGLWTPESFALWDDRASAVGILEKNGEFFAAAVDRILDISPGAVAFSVARGSQWASLETARRLKKLDPGLTIIVGGPYFTSERRVEEFLGESAVDIVAAGAGEDVIVKLAGLHDATGRWIALPGTWVKAGGSPQRGGKSIPFSFDLDLAPTPDFLNASAASYAKPFQMPLTASRGCEWKCFFCASREHWRKFSFKSGDRIYGEVLRAFSKNRALTHVEFYDLTANGRPEALRRFSEMVREHGVDGRKPTWRIQALARSEMTPELLATMADAGLLEVVYGLESASPRLLQAMNKPLSLDSVKSVLHNTTQAGIKCSVSLLAGFPGEKEEDIEETIRFLEKESASVDRAIVTPFAIEEPAYVFRFPGAFGVPFDVREKAESLLSRIADLGIEVAPGGYGAQARPDEALTPGAKSGVLEG